MTEDAVVAALQKLDEAESILESDEACIRVHALQVTKHAAWRDESAYRAWEVLLNYTTAARQAIRDAKHIMHSIQRAIEKTEL